uniref:Uncharacterized protein n=1 Tax=uncultured marine virus TaxID=186617 RepID=A0A0F7L1M9_9VIRU|nr:hypothetical protein [uncultured marine virus]
MPPFSSQGTPKALWACGTSGCWAASCRTWKALGDHIRRLKCQRRQPCSTWGTRRWPVRMRRLCLRAFRLSLVET